MEYASMHPSPVHLDVSLKAGGLSTRLPRLLTLEPDQIDLYWERLGAAGLRQPYGSHPKHGTLENLYGTAVDIPRELADYLAGAVRTLDGLIKRYIREAGSVTAWMKGRAPRFGGVPLNFEAVNRHLERQLLDPDPARRALLPFSLDLILTAGSDSARLDVVELQTGIGYAAILWRQLEALGFDPASPGCWAGRAPPLSVLRQVHRLLAAGEDVSVLATFPSLTENLRDETGWARLFTSDGLPHGFFLATDVQRDEFGWYHLEYELDPATGLPRLDAGDRPIRTGPLRMRRIRHVVTMQTQLELDHIHARLAPDERAAFLEFLSDADTVHWILPHSGWYLADKSLMGRFRADLLAAGNPLADLFVPAFVQGEAVVEPGDYVLKPVRGVGGRGLSDLRVEAAGDFVVPEGYVAQRRFHPFPLEIQLPEALEGAFPIPKGAAGLEDHRRDPRRTTGTLELRIFSLPGSTELEDAYVFMARLAPTWDPSQPSPTHPVLTNQSKIQTAVWNSPRITAQNWMYAPFGWTVVTIDAIRG